MYNNLTVVKLKSELIQRNVSTRGRKAELIERQVVPSSITD